MLQEFLRRGKKSGQTNLVPNFREGSSVELGFCSRPVWDSAYGRKSANRPPWKWWILRWIFAVDFWSQNAKKNPPQKSAAKIRRKKTKNPPAHDPPEIRLAGPKIRRKTYQQIRLSSLQVHAWFLRLRRFTLGGVFRAWILGHILAAFWAWSRLACLKCTCNPSAAVGGMDKVCCAPFHTTLLVKSVHVEKTAQK